ncbi:lytic transglycosylase domain-containing protein, partial [Candidatus Poribacteria bacterium]|nr:lytic transglycosylase domain-containing protein [Candidatus Poribacteria bacterium]
PTARELGLKVPEYKNIRQPNLDPQVDERFHPRLNLEAGVKYLNAMLKRYDGNYVLAVAAYNAGPGNVQKNVPLIRETERHVGKVLNHYYQYKLDTALRDADLQKLDALLVGGN